MKSFRGFIAVEIPYNDAIKNFYNDLYQLPTRIKLVELENMHITLKFLGNTKEDQVESIKEIMKKSIQNLEPFTIQLKGTGVFPNQNYIKIIWIGIEKSNPLSSICNYLNSHLTELGYKKDKHGFTPHLTIGRVKNALAKDQLIDIIKLYHDIKFNDIKVDRILLKKSTLTPIGPIYEIITEVNIT